MYIFKKLIYLQKAEYIVYVLIVYCEEKEDSSVFSSLTSEFIYSCWWISSLIRKTTMAPLNNILTQIYVQVRYLETDMKEQHALEWKQVFFNPPPHKKKKIIENQLILYQTKLSRILLQDSVIAIFCMEGYLKLRLQFLKTLLLTPTFIVNQQF